MLNAEEIKQQITLEQILSLVSEGLGGDGPVLDPNGSYRFRTVCHHEPHEGNFKLYYYPETHLFHCFSHCSDSFDLIELVQRAKSCSFKAALSYIIQYCGLSEYKGFKSSETVDLISDWDLINKIDRINKSISTQNKNKKTVTYNSNILDLFPEATPIEWEREGISPDVMRIYGIRVDPANQKVIIPHYDVKGRLVGIRGRSFDYFDLQEGRKYSPIYIEDKLYNHPLGDHLYGLYQNQDVIRRLKKIVITEGEKSTLLSATYFNYYDENGNYVNNNFTVSTCGSNLSQTQINLILSLGVEEVILAYDRENDFDPDSEVTKHYEEKLRNVIQPLATFARVYVIFDYDHKLGMKDSPFDRGKETLLELMKNKIAIRCEEDEQLDLNKIFKKARRK